MVNKQKIISFLIEWIIITIFLGITFTGGYFYGVGVEMNNADWHNNVSERLCAEKGLNITGNVTLQGFYSYKGYYCVRTDVPWYESQDTDAHESCHAFVRNDYQHFCLGIPEKYQVGRNETK